MQTESSEVARWQAPPWAAETVTADGSVGYYGRILFEQVPVVLTQRDDMAVDPDGTVTVRRGPLRLLVAGEELSCDQVQDLVHALTAISQAEPGLAAAHPGRA